MPLSASNRLNWTDQGWMLFSSNHPFSTENLMWLATTSWDWKFSGVRRNRELTTRPSERAGAPAGNSWISCTSMRAVGWSDENLVRICSTPEDEAVDCQPCSPTVGSVSPVITSWGRSMFTRIPGSWAASLNTAVIPAVFRGSDAAAFPILTTASRSAAPSDRDRSRMISTASRRAS